MAVLQLVQQVKPNPNGPWTYRPVWAIDASSGAPDAGKAVLTNAQGLVDTSMLVNALPSMAGNSGKFLTTNGTVASWAYASDLTNLPVGLPASLPSSGRVQLFPDYELVGQVPVMTSATTPSGTASASTSYAAVAPWQAFTGGFHNGWFSDGSPLPQWLQYQFPAPVLVRGYTIIPWSVDHFPARSPASWQVEGSNDGLAWSTLDSRTSYAGWVLEDTQSFTFAGNTTPYQYYRLNITATGGDLYAGVKDWQLLGNGTTVGFFSRDASGAEQFLGPLPDITGKYGLYLSTNGSRIFWSNTPSGLPSLSGKAGLYLTNDGTTVFWSNTPVYFSNPMTTPGDMIYGIAAGGGARLGIGSTGQVLTVVAGAPAWAAPASQYPTQTGQSGKYLTTDGTSVSWGAITQLPSQTGNAGFYLTTNGTTASWAAVATIPSVTGQSGNFLTNNGTVVSWASISQVPSMTGNSGKYLTNNGTAASWGAVSQIPTMTGNTGLFLTTDGTTASWASQYPPQAASAGMFLTTNGTSVSWANPPSGFANPMTTAWDLIVGGTGGAAARFPVGTQGQVLTVQVGGGLAWSTPTVYMSNPMTAAGDVIVGGTLGAPARVALGSAGQVLTVSGTTVAWTTVVGLPTQTGNSGKYLTTNGTSPSWGDPLPSQTGNSGLFLTTNGTTASWASPPTGFTNPMTSVGDLIVGTTGGAAARLAIGTANQVLGVSGATAAWIDAALAALPGQTGNSGKFLTTNGTLASWATVPTIPAMSVGTAGYYLTNNGTTANWAAWPIPSQVGQAGLYLGTDGTNMGWSAPVPSITGQSGKLLTNNGTSVLWAPAGTVALPSQTGNAGLYLTTDGTNASWASVTGALPAISGGTSGMWLTNNGTVASWAALTGLPAYSTANNGQFLEIVAGAPVWAAFSGMTNPLTTTGDIIYSSAGTTASRLGIGSAGQLLTVVGGVPAWANAPTELPAYSVANNGQVLEVVAGAPAWTSINQVPAYSVANNGQILEVVAGVPTWATPPSGFTNPMTASGDIIIGGTSGTALRLGIGTTGQMLAVVAGAPAWVAAPPGFANPMTTAGDLIAGNTSGTPGRLGIGSTGQVLTVVAGGPAWAAIPSQLPTMNGGTSGMYLTNNGATALWAALTVSQVPAVSGGTAGMFLGNNGTTYSWMAVPSDIPSMTGNAGYYLTTNGTTASWASITVLPSVTGQAGKVLSNDGTNVFWQSVSSSTTLGAVPLNFTSSSLASGASEIDTVNTTCVSFQLQTIAVTSPARVRFYPTYALALADLSRPATQDPTGNVGLMAEFLLTSTSLSWIVAPTVMCYNLDSPTQTTNIYMTIQNTGGTTTTVTVTGIMLKMQ